MICKCGYKILRETHKRDCPKCHSLMRLATNKFVDSASIKAKEELNRFNGD